MMVIVWVLVYRLCRVETNTYYPTFGYGFVLSLDLPFELAPAYDSLPLTHAPLSSEGVFSSYLGCSVEMCDVTAESLRG